MADYREIPPPPRVPTYRTDWQRNVDDRLDATDDRLDKLEIVSSAVARTEKKVDALKDNLDDLTRNVMRSLNREAEREPMQERELGNLKTEMAKASASSGRRWGALAGGVVTAIAALVELLR
jgi:hypothetical protein